MTTPYEAFLFGEIRSATTPIHLKHVAAILELGWTMFEHQYIIDLLQTIPDDLRLLLPLSNPLLAHLLYYPTSYHPFILSQCERYYAISHVYQTSQEAWFAVKNSDSCGNGIDSSNCQSAFLSIWYHDSILDRMPTKEDFLIFHRNFVPERNPMLPNSSQKYWRRVIREAGRESIPQTFLDPEIARLRSLLEP